MLAYTKKWVVLVSYLFFNLFIKMKRISLFLLCYLLFAGLGYAQERKNVIKTDLLQDVVGLDGGKTLMPYFATLYNLSYERRLSERLTLDVAFRWKWEVDEWGGFYTVLPSDFANNSYSHNGLKSRYIESHRGVYSVFGLGSSLKYYFKKALKGGYVGTKIEGYTFREWGQYDDIEEEYAVRSLQTGLEIGYQFLFWDRVSFDVALRGVVAKIWLSKNSTYQPLGYKDWGFYAFPSISAGYVF